MKKPIDQIKVGERDRSDLGDIQQLADSISANGLLHPVVINHSDELVAGGRRLAAVRSLGWDEVPVTVVDLATAAEVLRGEADENTCRKPLTPYEASRARERRAKVLAPKAEERKAQAPGKPRGEKAAPVSGSNLEPQTQRKTRHVAALGTGYSGSTLDKVDRIRDVAERGVIRHGKTEVPVPEPVQATAREALEEVKVTGAAVDRAHTKVADALDRFVQADPEIENAKFRSAMWKAIRSAGDLPLIDAEKAAFVADEDLWDALGRLRERMTSWLDAVEAQRPRGLRVVGK